MPGPFPGMDPYLEAPEFWRGFHSTMIPALHAQLNRILPDGFAAYIEERIYIVLPESIIIPDMVVTRQEPAVSQKPGRSALLERTADASETVTFYPDKIRELFVEIRRSGNRSGEVIAAVELLSPSNKLSGSRGHEEYGAKQRDLLESQTHLLEIDLLRNGAHTVSAPQAAVLARGHWDYLVSLHRAGQATRFEVWRNFLAQPLPRVNLPLTSELPDTVLDIQEAFDTAYDAGPYRRVIDYRLEPTPALSDQQRTWAELLLREKGYRS